MITGNWIGAYIVTESFSWKYTSKHVRICKKKKKELYLPVVTESPRLRRTLASTIGDIDGTSRVISSKKGGLLMYVDNLFHWYSWDCEAWRLFQFLFPWVIFAYVSLNIAGNTYWRSISWSSSLEGHISRRKTDSPVGAKPKMKQKNN